MNTYVGYTNIMPLLAPIDIGSNITATPYVSLRGVNRLAFLINFGVFTPAATTDFQVITVECATTENGGAETAVAYKYRLSGAVTDNTWGAITSVGATGAYINGVTGDGVSYWVEVDPDALGASDYVCARVRLIDDTNSTVCLVAVNAFVDQRYRMTTFVTATASASV